jgi:uncharacterized protein (DUF58 family)
MIVPRTRLLVAFAIVALPLAAVAAAAPQAVAACVLVAAAFAGVALMDAAMARRQLDGIRVELPALVRLQKDRAGEIELLIHNEKTLARPVRFGLAFPREIVSERDDLAAVLPAQSALSRLKWTCTPLKRGQYFLDRCHLEAASPLGLWAWRAASQTRSEIRVYPNLFNERKNVAALFLNRGTFGIHTHRQTGKGREFEKLREYVSGDSIDDIHWKASAKRGHPVTKVFQIERTQEIYVIIDASRLSAREVKKVESGKLGKVKSESAKWNAGAAESASEPASRHSLSASTFHSSTTTVLERFVTSAMVLGMAAEQQGDSYGLLIFSDKVRSFVRAKSGKTHYDACREAIYTVQPQIVTPDFDELCSFIRLRLRKRALLVFLTALDDPALAESFTRSMDLICRQHLILVNMVKPPGANPLFGRENVENIDDLYRHLGGHIRWQSLRELEKVLERRGVHFTLLDDERMSVQLVTQYLNVKARQLI